MEEIKERFFDRFFYAEDGSRDWNRWKNQDPNVVLEFILEELSKARKEGRKEERDRIFWELDRINCVDEALPKNYSAAGMQFGINKAKEIVLQKGLSKLKTNK